jgi:hypothetical protein
MKFMLAILILTISSVVSINDDGNGDAYALGSNGGYSIKNESNYKTPTMVNYLDHTGAYVDAKREQTVAEEKPSITEYYDGSRELNTFKVQCKLYSSLKDCTHHASCGWCGATNSCINGNQMGPREPCPVSTYVFTSPLYNAGENREINENVGGISMNLVTQ